MAKRYYRKTAMIVGALFIIATVTAVTSLAFLGTALDGPDYILDLPENGNSVTMAVAFELILAMSLIGIGSLMFPILRKQSEGLALGYSIIRLVESVFIVVASVSLLLMLSIGQDYAVGTLNTADSQSTGALLMALREWSILLGTLIFFGLGALVLNYLLYKSELVPRWISVWGVIGGAGVLLYGLIGLFGTDVYAMTATNLLTAPIAVQEMVLAMWLIVKGLNIPSTAYQ
jgi:hypothetical protein